MKFQQALNRPLFLVVLLHGATCLLAQESTSRQIDLWKKHVIFEGVRNQTAVAGDFTGDGLPDVIASCGGSSRMFVAPKWQEKTLFRGPRRNWNCIHSEVMDVDGDGDLDYIDAVAKQGVFWLENPANSLEDDWEHHVIDNQIHGIHCTLKADINGDGKPDLLVNNFAADGATPNSLTWLQSPKEPRGLWLRHVLGKGDAPGGNHYFGFGDVDGDGRGDVCIGAKGKPFENGNWFAWWKNQADPTQPWKKELIAKDEAGATCIMPGDLNGDGQMDFFATRGHGKGVLWFEGPKWKKHEIDPSIEAPHCLQLVDVDGDGDLDGVTCARLSKLAVWYENDGRGKFTPRVVDKNQAAYDIRAIDMDNDGDVDFVVAGESSKNIVWYEQPK